MGCSGCSFKGMSTAVEDTFVGVRFREETNLTLCAHGRADLRPGGEGGGGSRSRVRRSATWSSRRCRCSSPARSRARGRSCAPADDEDLAAYDRQLPERAERQALRPGAGARASSLDMKISLVDFALSGKKATFYFTSDGQGGLPAAGARPVEPVLACG